MVPPEFIVIGAAKCGTTALWKYLDAHPGVYMSYVKEPRYFTRFGGGLARGEMDDQMPRAGTYDQGLDWYVALFDEAAPGTVRGEASTVYAVAPDAPALIRAYNPDVRLILMVRDPVERMHSHYWQERKAGWDPGPFAEIVAEGHPRARYYEAMSHYAATADRFLEHFGRDQLLVLANEDLDEDPEAALQRVFAFLGVDPSFRPASLGRRYNVQRAPRFPALRRFVEWSRGRVGPRLPWRFRQWLGRMQRRLDRRLSTPVDYDPLDPALREALLPRFEADVRFVEAWTGTPRPAWRAVGEAVET